MGSGFAKMRKQARMMQDQLQKAQEEMKNISVEGEAGGGLVKVTVNGESKIQNVAINPECVDPSDVDGLQDLMKAACEDAYAKLEEQSPMDGLSLPFGM